MINAKEAKEITQKDGSLAFAMNSICTQIQSAAKQGLSEIGVYSFARISKAHQEVIISELTNLGYDTFTDLGMAPLTIRWA